MQRSADIQRPTPRRAALRARLVSAALVASGAMAGCGGATPQALFGRDCGVCHSIAGPARRSQQGGDLRGLSLSARQITQFTAEMPRLHGPLSPAEIRALTRYVSAAERR